MSPVISATPGFTLLGLGVDISNIKLAGVSSERLKIATSLRDLKNNGNCEEFRKEIHWRACGVDSGNMKTFTTHYIMESLYRARHDHSKFEMGIKELQACVKQNEGKLSEYHKLGERRAEALKNGDKTEAGKLWREGQKLLLSDKLVLAISAQEILAGLQRNTTLRRYDNFSGKSADRPSSNLATLDLSHFDSTRLDSMEQFLASHTTKTNRYLHQMAQRVEVQTKA